MIKYIIALLKSLWNIIVQVDAMRYEVVPSIPLHEPLSAPETPIVPVVNKATVYNFCLAIQSREGYIAPCSQYPTGTSSWRHKNPGNCKDLQGNFLTFTSYELGFAYLDDYVRRVMGNKHKAYPKDPTIAQYFSVYAPTSDKNDPLSYAVEVAKKCGVDTSFLIKNLV